MKNLHYFSNFRHYSCYFGRHYLSNFQITVLKTMYFSVIIPSFKSSFICHGNFPLKDDFSIPDNSPLAATCYYCQVSTSPLLFEFGVEKLYPISEGMIGGWLNIWCISSCISSKTHFFKTIKVAISVWLFVVQQYEFSENYSTCPLLLLSLC